MKPLMQKLMPKPIRNINDDNDSGHTINAQSSALEDTIGYGAMGSNDTVNVSAGFVGSLAVNPTTTDALVNGNIAITAVPAIAEYSTTVLSDGYWTGPESNATIRATLPKGDLPAAGDTVKLLLNGTDFATPKTAMLSAQDIANGYVDFTVAKADLGADGFKFLDASITNADGTQGKINYAMYFTLDTVAPTATIAGAAYNEVNNELTLTGTHFTTLLENGGNISSGFVNRLDWAKLAWDINGDADVTPDITFTQSDISSAKVANDTTLTIKLTNAKSAALESVSGYGAIGGADTINIGAGFAKDLAGNAATTDALVNGDIAITAAPIAEHGTTVLNDAYWADLESSATIRTTLPKGDLPAVGDTVKLLLNGTDFATPKTAMLSAQDIANGYVDFTVAKADLGSDGFKFLDASIAGVDSTQGKINQAVFFTLDTAAPTVTIAGAAYNEVNNELTLTGTHFNTLLESSENKYTNTMSRLDWAKLAWDVNGDNNVTPDITFAQNDISSVKVANDTMLTIRLTDAKSAALESVSGYGAAGGADTFNVGAGFAKDLAGNAATTDALVNGEITITAAPAIAEHNTPVPDDIYWTTPWTNPEEITHYECVLAIAPIGYCTTFVSDNWMLNESFVQ